MYVLCTVDLYSIFILREPLPLRLFSDVDEDASNQRPDIFIRNPRGLGRQVIIDVAVTGVDGQSRSNDEATERPLQARYDQKMAKYGRIAEQSNLLFVPAVFSHTGQIHGDFKAFVREQIKQKLVAFEGDAKPSKTRSTMKWWSKCISMAIAKTASRNVASLPIGAIKYIDLSILRLYPYICRSSIPNKLNNLHHSFERRSPL